jgi:hypothetical protein
VIRDEGYSSETLKCPGREEITVMVTSRRVDLTDIRSSEVCPGEGCPGNGCCTEVRLIEVCPRKECFAENRPAEIGAAEVSISEGCSG